MRASCPILPCRMPLTILTLLQVAQTHAPKPNQSLL